MNAQAAPVAVAFQTLLDEIALDETCRTTERIIHGLNPETGHRLHLGCGPDIRPGWLNLDVAPPQGMTVDDRAHFYQYDLRRGLPLDDGTCSLVYSSHVFEHFDLVGARVLMQDCCRVMNRGGRFRIVLPDIRAALSAYLKGDCAWYALAEQRGCVSDYEPGRPRTINDYANWIAYQCGQHKAILDEETIVSMLTRLGLRNAAVVPFTEEIDGTSLLRKQYSFCVEATKE